jgi:Fe-S-cluster-containing dehydrogenase component
VDGSAFPRVVSPPSHRAKAAAATPPATTGVSPDGLDIVFLPDPKVYDGSFGNNGWLQELPAPITQVMWGNAALLAPLTARRLGVATDDDVTVTLDSRRIAIRALVVPGHAEDAVSLHLGYGRSGAENVGRGIGSNAYALWRTPGIFRESGGTLARGAGGELADLVRSQTTTTMENREPVRQATLSEYRAAPNRVGDRAGRVLSLYPDAEPAKDATAGRQWAMTIDLTTCIGCGACVVACQAENNVPVVGRDESANGRAMHWLRVDRYFDDVDGDPDVLVQPMLCQHCEKAPCEYVCPVEATVHSTDGLNEMVYNRCVGTRFCSNNCPYKVRRFNWYDYNAHLSELEVMAKNPDVTVRERGVMEKCSFCVQRIREAEIGAGREGRELRGSEVRTACQQACPTKAIVFGSLDEPDSEMARLRREPRAYSALGDLGTEPRVRYLARIRNTNPDVGQQP